MSEKEYIIQDAIYDFRMELEGKFIEMCRGNDYNKLTLLRICDTICEIYDKYIEKHYTTDVVKVRHGKWIADGDSGGIVLQCSLCNEPYWIEWDEDKNPNFCPNCGARMDGDE